MSNVFPTKYDIPDCYIIDLLSKLCYVGKMYPVSRNDKRQPICALLAGSKHEIKSALHEINEALLDGLNPTYNRDDLMNFCERNEIAVYADSNEFLEHKEMYHKMDKDSTEFNRLWERYLKASGRATTVAMAA